MLVAQNFGGRLRWGATRPRGRLKLSNGKKLLPMSDGRSMVARRFRDLYLDICNDLGGIDRLSEGQRQLSKRAAMLSAESERMEALAARGDKEEFDCEAYGLCDRLGRLFTPASKKTGRARRCQEDSSPYWRRLPPIQRPPSRFFDISRRG
jgi:hypothetical protein